ncbi:MAG: M48 family metallopeptidase [Lachnospiraceae bacterium]|nr:M48 family metallopeptidase [Lachnospiraceae bacterium]
MIKKGYQLQRSNRKSIVIKIKEDGTVLIKAPNFVSEKEIDRIVQKRADWIAKCKERQNNKRTFTEQEISEYRKRARLRFTETVRNYESQLGVSVNKIYVKDQKTRWGSCSNKGNINLNWRLILAPQEVMEYVIIHELCHLKEMNHSKNFWKLVEDACPDYRERKQWLKENADKLGC